MRTHITGKHSFFPSFYNPTYGNIEKKMVIFGFFPPPDPLVFLLHLIFVILGVHFFHFSFFPQIACQPLFNSVKSCPRPKKKKKKKILSSLKEDMLGLVIICKKLHHKHVFQSPFYFPNHLFISHISHHKMCFSIILAKFFE